jgi:MoxR-like ATPase
MFKILVDYPSAEAEQEVLRRYHHGFDAHALAEAGLTPVVKLTDLPAIKQEILAVHVEEGILAYITEIAGASRRSRDLLLGGSPRASIDLLRASKTWAALQGMDFVTPDHVKPLVAAVYRHRVILRPEAEIEGLDADAAMRRVLGQVEAPR